MVRSVKCNSLVSTRLFQEFVIKISLTSCYTQIRHANRVKDVEMLWPAGRASGPYKHKLLKNHTASKGKITMYRQRRRQKQVH
jgi:hypothetical protein